MAALVRGVVGDVLRGARMSEIRTARRCVRFSAGEPRVSVGDRRRRKSLPASCSVRFVRLCSSRCRGGAIVRASGWRVKSALPAPPAGRQPKRHH